MSREHQPVEPTPIDPETLARLPEFYHPIVSPDGERVAFYHDDTGRNELEVLDLDSGARERWSDGEVPRNARWPIGWDADGARVFFHRDEGGDEQNDVYAIDGEGAVERVIAVDGQAILHDVCPEGRSLYYGSDEGDQMNLYRVELESGASRQLTSYDQPVWSAVVGPAGEQVAYAANESSQLENRDAYVMAADGSRKRKLDVGEEGAECVPADWHPDGDRVLFTDTTDDLARAGVYDLESDDVTWISDGSAEEAAVAFSPSGERVVTARTREAATVPVVYETGLDEQGVGTEFDLPEGVAGVASGAGGDAFVDDATVVLAHTASDERKALVRYDLDTHTTETLLEPDYGDLDPDAFVEAEYVTYESEDSLRIGALLYDARDGPAVAADATDQPGVVMVHGGPHSHSSKAFDLYAQFLATRGYTVLQPNYRGSTGRGREFKQLILGDWGGMEQADVAAGGRWLASREWIDPNRVAVFGGSYGGYSTYMQLVTYPDLWTTGIAWIGITDLPRLYEESMPHFQATLEQQLGDPEENAALWQERSPITHVDELVAPIFIIHGVNDVRCPISQARLFRDALLERGWEEGTDFEYEELGEEGHGSTDVDQKLRAFSLLGDYLDRRL